MRKRNPRARVVLAQEIKNWLGSNYLTRRFRRDWQEMNALFKAYPVGCKLLLNSGVVTVTGHERRPVYSWEGWSYPEKLHWVAYLVLDDGRRISPPNVMGWEVSY